MGGTKYDNDKIRMDLIPSEVFIQIGKVMTFGAKIYGDHNWREGINHSRLYAASLRHLVDYWDGNTFDSESNLSHLSHALTNLAMIIATPEHDDRFIKKDNNGKNSDNIRHRNDSNTRHRGNGCKKMSLRGIHNNPNHKATYKADSSFSKHTTAICPVYRHNKSGIHTSSS